MAKLSEKYNVPLPIMYWFAMTNIDTHNELNGYVQSINNILFEWINISNDCIIYSVSCMTDLLLEYQRKAKANLVSKNDVILDSSFMSGLMPVKTLDNFKSGKLLENSPYYENKYLVKTANISDCIGPILRGLRIKENLSINFMANNLGVSHQQVRILETSSRIKAKYVTGYCNALNIDPSPYLLEKHII